MLARQAFNYLSHSTSPSVHFLYSTKREQHEKNTILSIDVVMSTEDRQKAELLSP
jgi:hypothetical protein